MVRALPLIIYVIVRRAGVYIFIERVLCWRCWGNVFGKLRTTADHAGVIYRGEVKLFKKS